MLLSMGSVAGRGDGAVEKVLGAGAGSGVGSGVGVGVGVGVEDA